MLSSDTAFTPPHCPHRECRHHPDSTGWRYRRHGTFQRKTAPRVIRRFQCLSCLRTFSSQTFDTTYWLKKPEIQQPLLLGLVACSGFRQLGRSLGVAGTTTQRQAARLGRHCLLFHQLRLPPSPPREDLDLDGLLSFEFSQFWPFETNVLVGADSYFTYAFTEAERRRSGRMTPAQATKRALLEECHGKPDPKATKKSVVALIRLVAPQPTAMRIRSDEHQAYPRAFRELAHDIAHSTVSSRRCRTESIAQVAQDVELVEQDARLWCVTQGRVAKRLPHVHHREPNPSAFPRSQPREELVHAGLGSVLAAEPDRAPTFEIAHHDAIGVSLPDPLAAHLPCLPRGDGSATSRTLPDGSSGRTAVTGRACRVANGPHHTRRASFRANRARTPTRRPALAPRLIPRTRDPPALSLAGSLPRRRHWGRTAFVFHRIRKDLEKYAEATGKELSDFGL